MNQNFTFIWFVVRKDAQFNQTCCLIFAWISATITIQVNYGVWMVRHCLQSNCRWPRSPLITLYGQFSVANVNCTTRVLFPIFSWRCTFVTLNTNDTVVFIAPIVAADFYVKSDFQCCWKRNNHLLPSPCFVRIRWFGYAICWASKTKSVPLFEKGCTNTSRQFNNRYNGTTAAVILLHFCMAEIFVFAFTH